LVVIYFILKEKAFLFLQQSARHEELLYSLVWAVGRHVFRTVLKHSIKEFGNVF
jgi:hypothetical protein